jgi:transcriptional regulator with XRE-family HTH domain
VKGNRSAAEAEAQRQIGERLRRARTRHGWSLSDVEKETNGEIAGITVGSYERGDRACTAARLVVLADVYGVPAASLLPGRRNDDDRRHAVWFEELSDEYKARAAALRDGVDVTPPAQAPHVAEGPGS